VNRKEYITSLCVEEIHSFAKELFENEDYDVERCGDEYHLRPRLTAMVMGRFLPVIIVSVKRVDMHHASIIVEASMQTVYIIHVPFSPCCNIRLSFISISERKGETL